MDESGTIRYFSYTGHKNQLKKCDVTVIYEKFD